MEKGKTYKKIIDCAGKLFAQRGYFGVSLNQIAQEVGITKPALYYYFESKEALYLAVLEQTFSSLLKTLQKAASRADTPLAKIFNVIEAYLVFTLERPEVTLLAQDWEKESNFAKFTRQARQQLVQFLKTLINALGKGAQVSEEKLTLLISFFLEIVRWPFLLALTTPKKLAEEIIRLFFPNIIPQQEGKF